MGGTRFMPIPGEGYVYPGTLRALRIAVVWLLMSGLFYALRKSNAAIKPLHAAMVTPEQKTTPLRLCTLSGMG